MVSAVSDPCIVSGWVVAYAIANEFSKQRSISVVSLCRYLRSSGRHSYSSEDLICDSENGSLQQAGAAEPTSSNAEAIGWSSHGQALAAEAASLQVVNGCLHERECAFHAFPVVWEAFSPAVVGCSYSN